jgi:hypothetical protein
MTIMRDWGSDHVVSDGLLQKTIMKGDAFDSGMSNTGTRPETHTYEIHAREIHALETPAHQMHARGMHAREVQINHKRPYTRNRLPPKSPF